MWVCEKCGAIKADQYEKCLVCSLSSDVADSRQRLQDAAAPNAFLPIIEGDVPSPQVGMPRRFGIGTLMTITVFFALLFGILKMLCVTPIVFIAIVAFIVVVAVCQALLYGGKNPRRASFIAGVVMYWVATLATVAIGGFFHSGASQTS